jgi:quercetin dioxygenase-like cupin family protein
MIKCIPATIASVAIAASLGGARAETLSPTAVFDGSATTLTKNGTVQPVHISVQSWGIAGQEQEIPLREFYVAHLLSGAISATIDGQTTEHLPGDYWAVKAGAAMRVKVLGEVAVLETTVVVKQ